MKSFNAFLTACLCGLHVQAGPDLLRFDNGDQLSGRFLGISGSGGIRLQSDEMKEPAEFRLDSVRHLVLHGGKAQQAVESSSYVGLSNGDRIPGNVSAIDDTHITVETKFAGTVRIPKDHVQVLAPNTLGGDIQYYGPFSDEGWNIVRNPSAEPADKDAKKKQPWEFSGSAWFWDANQTTPDENTGSVALVRPQGMPDRSILRFRMDWKDRIGMAIAFHADFAKGEAEKDKNPGHGEFRRESSSIPAIFGNGYVLQIYSTSIMLYRSTMDPQTGARFERIQMPSSVRLREGRGCVMEIRSNRTNGHIALYLDGEFAAQWSEPAGNAPDSEGFAGKGSGFGFLPQVGCNALRISEVSICEWNGMPDSARSMEVDDKDVVLMTNGTDRFAGKLIGMEGGEALRFETRHGIISVPLAEIAEIRFARSHLAKPETNNDPVFHLAPTGRLAAKAIAGDHDVLKLQHAILGPMELHMAPVILIEYKSGTKLSDNWNDDL